MPIKNTSIKRKVMTAIMVTVITVLLLMVAAFMIYDLVTFRQAMARNLVTQGEIVAENSTAALAFKNENDARNILDSLHADPNIEAAVLYDADGKLFVKYPDQALDLPVAPKKAGVHFEKSKLILFQPVFQSGRRLGTLYLRSDLDAIFARLELYGVISLLIMLGSLLVAFWLSNTMQRRIANPIIALAKTAQKISEQRDYSMRAEKLSNDEIGLLTDSFNNMLNRIQASDSAVRASEAQFRLVTDQAPVLLAHMDRDYRYKFVNRPYAASYGRTPHEVIGKHAVEIVGLELFEKARRHVEKAMAGETVQFELEIPDAVRGSRWSHAEYTPERAPSGEVIGFVAVHTDITERKRTEAASRQLAAIVESSDDAIISKNLNGIIISWNHGAEKLFGYTAAEVLHRPITILMPDDRLNEEPNILDRIRRGESIEHYETIRRRKDGTLIEISLTVSPIKNTDGTVVGASKIARDISEQKQAERKLEQAHKEAVAASHAKDDFLAALSHELRTPLNPVLLLASDAAANPELPDETRAQFEMIRRNVELEARLIDDLLDLTRITRGKLSLDMKLLDAHHVLHEAIATVRADAEKKQIELVLDLRADKCGVFGDATRLQQIFWNVLKNAVKFTPDGGKVTVHTFAKADALFVKIVDTGIGIKPDELTRVFDAFSQGDHAETSSHRFGGLGLGLAISRMLVELHSGSIHAESAGSGQGATFLIELSLATLAKKDGTPASVENLADIPPPAAPEKNHAQPLRILLVEDHEPTRTILTQLLTRRHYEVIPAASLAEARSRANAGQTFDLVISDIGLPDGSGYDLMAELRERHNLKGIALTGYGTEKDIARSQKSGFVAHLTKPVRIESLDNVLAGILNVKS